MHYGGRSWLVWLESLSCRGMSTASWREGELVVDRGWCVEDEEIVKEKSSFQVALKRLNAECTSYERVFHGLELKTTKNKKRCFTGSRP